MHGSSRLNVDIRLIVAIRKLSPSLSYARIVRDDMIECNCRKCELLEARIRVLTGELKDAHARIDELKEEIGELEYRERVFTIKGY